MAETTWPKFVDLDPQNVTAARRQAHNALHWLVRFSNSFGEPEQGGEGLTLRWNDRDGVIQTRPFLDDYSVELRVAPLEMQFREKDTPVPHTLGFEERTPAHVEAWVLVELLHRGIDRNRYSKMLPYTVQDLMTGDSEDFTAEAYRHELVVLEQSFRAGAAVLEEVRSLAGLDSGAPLLCWPQVFQIGFETDLPPNSGARALRVGIAAGDGVRPEPYFYVGTADQARTASFVKENIISLRDLAANGTSAKDVATTLTRLMDQTRRKLLG
ncbi:MAG: hypothetical protein AB7E80_15390 [Hyphomicrobiaceae bacterium]